jgi:hypothetical protein
MKRGKRNKKEKNMNERKIVKQNISLNQNWGNNTKVKTKKGKQTFS